MLVVADHVYQDFLLFKTPVNFLRILFICEALHVLSNFLLDDWKMVK